MKITFVSRGRFIPSATEGKIRVETFDNALTDFGEWARRWTERNVIQSGF